ncbi:RDD family protein [Brachybacterium timonense]|uniref:RDD family protein n=1 Tax=Brachybacterium timonense TaxID=2050896 RepID=UPI000D0B21C5|nr:RDD family protein [Brachybacterium timonense]
MSTRYCSTCGTLLSESAVICGECGARYQESPYEKRATDAPGAWSSTPKARSRDLGRAPEENAQEKASDTGVQLLSSDALAPKNPGATALRTQEQYDQLMATQQPHTASQPANGSADDGSSPRTGELGYPLDGCEPASVLKRLLAAVIDTVIGTIVMVPMTIGITLILVQDKAGLLAQILVGVGAAVPAAYTVVMWWLLGAKGFTLGKLIMGLRVTRTEQGGPIGFGRSLGRWALYGVIPWLMALSIFFDPRKVLRGFHDRAVGAVVTDVRSGRNPMHPRPDDFERPDASEYLGQSSVEVQAHDNLLATPGAAWNGQQTHKPAPAAAVDTSWAPAEPAPAQQEQGHPAPQPTEQHAWQAPPPGHSPVQATGQAHPVSPYGSGQPAPGPTGFAAPSAAPVGDAQPAPASAPHEQTSAPSPNWGPPASAWDTGSPAAEAGSWQPPVVDVEPSPAAPMQQSTEHPAAQVPAPHSSVTPAQQASSVPEPTAHTPAPPAMHAPEPRNSTGVDAGVDEATRLASDIDEHTRPDLSSLEDEDEDLEATRLSPAAHPRPRLRIRLVADDGTETTVDRPVVVGRNPAAREEGDERFVVKDSTRSVSKTHLRVDPTGEDVMVTDLGSTNGSAITREDGEREALAADTPVALPDGAGLAIGDRTLTVERVQ